MANSSTFKNNSLAFIVLSSTWEFDVNFGLTLLPYYVTATNPSPSFFLCRKLLWYFHIYVGLPMFWVSKFEFHSEKWILNIFWGYEDCVCVCVCACAGGGGNHKAWLIFGVIFMQFRVFSCSQGTEREYVLGVTKISNFVWVCLVFQISFMGKQ